MSKTILSFGEVLWDLLPTGPKLGGAPLNFANRINSLGDEGIIVSRLGQDELGQKAWDAICSLGLVPRYLQIEAKHPTGTVHVSFDDAKNPDYVIVPDVAYDHIEITPDLLSLATASDCVCFGTLSQRSKKTRKTLYRLLDAAGKAVKLLDVNLRKDCYSIETVLDSLQWADILKLNDSEAKQLADMLELPDRTFDTIIRNLVERYSLDCCVATLGPAGVLACSADGKTVYVPGYQVDMADPLGSGDAFAAGFLYKYLRHTPLAECCDFGNVLGAIVASQEGATAPFTWDDISNFDAVGKQRVSRPDLEIFVTQ